MRGYRQDWDVKELRFTPRYALWHVTLDGVAPTATASAGSVGAGQEPQAPAEQQTQQQADTHSQQKHTEL